MHTMVPRGCDRYEDFLAAPGGEPAAGEVEIAIATDSGCSRKFREARHDREDVCASRVAPVVVEGRHLGCPTRSAGATRPVRVDCRALPSEARATPMLMMASMRSMW